MAKESIVHEPILVRANSQAIGEESVYTVNNFDGCNDAGYNRCGAWGMGLCRITVSLGNVETPTSAVSATRLLAVGCTECDMAVIDVSKAAHVNVAASLPISETDYGEDGDVIKSVANYKAHNTLYKQAKDQIITSVQVAIRQQRN